MGDLEGADRRGSNTMIGKMVDNILKESEEIDGHDDDLSGDEENREPIFKIERINDGKEIVMDVDDLGGDDADESNLFV